MQFPRSLKQRDRLQLSENYILSWHYMYARHPRTHWSEDDEFPKFEEIRSKQSFNWSAYSIPVWARFTDQMIYQDGYGVAGYRVQTIRKAHEICEDLPQDACGVKHIPIENNYSHCELYLDKITRKDKRLYRLTLKNGVRLSVLPGAVYKDHRYYFECAIMRGHRFSVRMKQLFGRVKVD